MIDHRLGFKQIFLFSPLVSTTMSMHSPPAMEGIPENKTCNPVVPACKDKNVQKRRPRAYSRVSIDFFDPSGVQNLQTTLTRVSTFGGQSSNVTLAQSPTPDTPFDFEATLRSIFQQYAVCYCSVELY